MEQSPMRVVWNGMEQSPHESGTSANCIPSLAGQTLTWKERVWSNSHQAFVLHILDEPLDGGRFIFERILAGNLQAFTMYS